MLGVSPPPPVSRFLRRMSSSARRRSADSLLVRSALALAPSFALALAAPLPLPIPLPKPLPSPPPLPSLPLAAGCARARAREGREELEEEGRASREASWVLIAVRGSCTDLRARSRRLRAQACGNEVQISTFNIQFRGGASEKRSGQGNGVHVR